MNGKPSEIAANGQRHDDGGILRLVSSTTTPITFEQTFTESQEPIFPPELQLSDAYDKQYLEIRGSKITWYRPTNLMQLLELKEQFPHAKVVVGNTEVALEMKFKQCDYPIIIHPTMVKEITSVVKDGESSLVVGGAVTLSTFQAILKTEIDQHCEKETRMFAALDEMLHWFAGKQIRNVAAIAGNIMTGSPISDLNPLFMVAGCILTLASKSGGIRRVAMDHKFFTGYRRNIVLPNEILLNITMPRTREDEYIYGYKQSRRREDDIAIVNVGCPQRIDGFRISQLN